MAGDGQISRVHGTEAKRLANPATREQLVEALGELAPWVDLSTSEPTEVPEISDEMRERLQALGYQQ